MSTKRTRDYKQATTMWLLELRSQLRWVHAQQFDSALGGLPTLAMQQRTVTISNRLGLHARAAARLVRRASQFNSSIELVREDTGESADGKSILSVLLLAASRGTCLIIKAEGDDEERAVEALAELVEQRFLEELSDGVF